MAAITLKIQRFNPSVDSKPHRESYTVDAEPSDRVLDLLNRINMTIPPNASCAPPAPEPAHPSGRTVASLGCKRWSRRTASSLIVGTEARPSAWPFSTTVSALGGAATRETVPTRAPGGMQVQDAIDQCKREIVLESE